MMSKFHSQLMKQWRLRCTYSICRDTFKKSWDFSPFYCKDCRQLDSKSLSAGQPGKFCHVYPWMYCTEFQLCTVWPKRQFLKVNQKKVKNKTTGLTSDFLLGFVATHIDNTWTSLKPFLKKSFCLKFKTNFNMV